MEQDRDVLVDELLGDRRHGRDGLGNPLGKEWPHVALDELEEHRHEVLDGFLEVREEEIFVVHRLNGRRSLPGHRAIPLLAGAQGAGAARHHRPASRLASLVTRRTEGTREMSKSLPIRASL